MQKTIKNEIVIRGIGVHTGEESSLIMKPASPNTGIIFRKDSTTIPALIEFATPVEFGTALRCSNTKVRGYEHLLSCLYGLGIDNLICEIDGKEAPALDGSALPFIKAIEEVGICVQNTEKLVKRIESPIYLTHNDTFIMALPDEDFRVSYLLDYGVKYPGIQYINLKIDPESYKKEIGGARTYTFMSWIDDLRKKGLIKGGSLNNAIVIDENGPIGSNPLRFADEFVRHKVLDLIGDLALIGYPIKGHIFGIKSGHKTNIPFVRKLKDALGK
ncbi:MAG TPA: UDP-3-O-[3-hydroxymyristoyl] N-acetylglucosamine deacetylase [bacterium (Candidatus Stahlbacteria)]|nr:UDP-3-O-[3-hydroxymyristoyl] N-acetylglucosamine deacetylase [Candidatus Stahlbacteria bacterium]